MKVKLSIVLSFIGWAFMKMFSGCFTKAIAFREELKKGAPDSIFAFFGFVILAIITLAIIVLASAALCDDKHTVQVIVFTSFWAVVATLVYNVVKAAFECFLEEQQRTLDILRDSK